jgi:hypothetical protein
MGRVKDLKVLAGRSTAFRNYPKEEHTCVAAGILNMGELELLGFWTLSIVRNSEITTKHNVSETASVPVFT